MTNAQLVEHIKSRSYASGVTVADLLAKAGVSGGTLWRWKNQPEVKPHPITLGKVTNALDALEKERAA